MAVQVERKAQQQPRQRATKQETKSASLSSLPVKGSAGRREPAGGRSHSNQASGEPQGMRSMPPNATQSMMMQKQPVQAKQQSQQPVQANQVSQASSSGTSQPASLKQQQAGDGGQLTGGQRAAFKISTSSVNRGAQFAAGQLTKDDRELNETSSIMAAGPTLPAGSQGQPIAADQQQLQPNSGPKALECSMATGPNSSTLGEPDDPSECSCSNSFDCLTDEGSSQVNFHGAHRQPPPVHQQHYLHHQQPHPAPAHHVDHSYHSQHHHQHQNQQNFHHQSQAAACIVPPHYQHHERLLQPEEDPFRLQGGQMTPQHLHHTYHHHRNKQHPHHLHQQVPFYQHQMAPNVAVHNQHRPLLLHTSLPPLHSRNYPSMGAPTYSPPPPLVRHGTYATTSETITDSPIQSMRRHNYTHPSSPTNHNSSHNTNHPSDYYNPDNETDLLISNKSDTNFRRSATTREPESSRWHPVGQQQTHASYSGEQAQYDDHADSGLTSGGAGGSLQRHTATGRNNSGSHDSPQHHQPRMSLNRRANSQTNNTCSNNKPPGRQALGNDNTQHNSATTAFQYTNDLQQQNQQTSSTGNNPNPVNNIHQSQAAASANLLNTAPGGVISAVNPFEAAATFCPPILTIPPPPLPIGPLAITSHRTNSPWMRLSSIILTPVGIVIAFFIVISPLLHYLM